MRKVDLRMNEQFKYVIIKKLVDSNGNKKNAAIKLNCSLRTVNRLIIKYKMEGKQGFVHKNRGRKPATAFTDDIKAKVIDLYITKYFGANLAHFSQLLNKHGGFLSVIPPLIIGFVMWIFFLLKPEEKPNVVWKLI